MKNNIYKKLGAPVVDSVSSKSRVPEVFIDGSTSDKTKSWALEKLGFIDTEEYQYSSWCETSDRSAVVPFSVKWRGMVFYLHPISGRPGYFCLEYGNLGSTMLTLLDIYSAKEVLVALGRTIKEMDRIKAEIPDSATTNTHLDKRYNYDNEERAWLYKGKKYKLKYLYLSDGTQLVFI
jgi:hypothetical protein